MVGGHRLGVVRRALVRVSRAGCVYLVRLIARLRSYFTGARIADSLLVGLVLRFVVGRFRWRWRCDRVGVVGHLDARRFVGVP